MELRIENLSKSYGSKKALKGMTCTLDDGVSGAACCYSDRVPALQ